MQLLYNEMGVAHAGGFDHHFASVYIGGIFHYLRSTAPQLFHNLFNGCFFLVGTQTWIRRKEELELVADLIYFGVTTLSG